jgi:hypothetical protein
MRSICVLLFIGCLAFAQEASASPAPEANAAAKSNSKVQRRVTTVRRTARAGSKPRKIKAQKMKGAPKFKRPRRY